MTSPYVIGSDSPTSPRDWLDVLTREMDQRRAGILALRSYTDGNAPLPEMTKETRQAWQSFQKRSRTNMGELIIDSVVDRLVPNGVTVGGSIDTPNAKQAQAIWKANRMNSVFKSWVRYGMIFGQSYMTVWKGKGDKETVITADSPETMLVVTDPLQHWKPLAAVRVWRDRHAAQDYAIVWSQGSWQQFTRPTYATIELKVIPSKWLVNLAQGAWTDEDQPGGNSDSLEAPIPVVVYNNPGGHGDFEHHTDLINRINAGILERLVIAAIQAFRQRAITGGTLPERDEKGNFIDYSKVFAPAPGALWNLPKDLDIWESQPVDLTGILNASKEDIRQLSAVTRTPLPMLMPDNANTSAEGAKETSAGHVFRCLDRLAEAKFGIQEVMDLALKVDGADLDDDEHTEVSFANVQLITIAEKYAAALAAHNSGESRHSIQRNILGYSPDQINQDDIDLAHEALIAAATPPQPTTVEETLTAPAPTAPPPADPAAPGSTAAPTAAAPTAALAAKGQQPQPKIPGTPGVKKQPTTLGGLQPGGRK